MNQAYTTESNELSSSGAWILLLEILLDNTTLLRYARDSDDVVWPSTGGNTYTAMPFSMDDISVSLSGKFPEYKLQIGDVELDSALHAYINDEDGLVGGEVRLMVVHSDHLNLTTPAIDEYAEILDCEVNASGVIFTVGIPTLLNKRFPRDRYTPSFCRHKFGGGLCKYAGTEFTTCNHTLDDCTERNNSTNFGGSPGIIGGVYG